MTDAAYRTALEYAIRQARTDFSFYLRLFNPPETGFVFSQAHEFIARRIQTVAEGRRRRRQALSMPPQHGKSTIATVEATSWILGRNPGIQAAIAGFSHDLMTDFSKRIKERVNHPLYREIFPEARIIDGSNRMDLWELTNGSKLTAKSVGRKLTGRRVDWLIVDDPHAGREEAESETMRRKVQRWYEADCVSRLSPDAAVFLIATRWHPQDLIGYLTAPERVEELRELGAGDEIFEVTNLPAFCEDDAKDPLGRQEGEALFPEVRGRAFLEKIRATLPAYEWESQYQGNPRTSLSGSVDVDRLQFITAVDLPEGLELVRGWDLALTEEQSSDFSAGCLAGYDAAQDKLYIADMFRTKRTWTKLRSGLLSQAREDREGRGVYRIGIEAVAGFLAVFQDVKGALLGEIKVEPRRPPRGGKLLRAQPWLTKIEAGRVFIVRGAWNKDFIAELECFPQGDHDDQVDAVSTAWEMLTGRHRNGGIPSDKPRERRSITRRSVKRRSIGERRESGPLLQIGEVTG